MSHWHSHVLLLINLHSDGDRVMSNQQLFADYISVWKVALTKIFRVPPDCVNRITLQWQHYAEQEPTMFFHNGPMFYLTSIIVEYMSRNSIATDLTCSQIEDAAYCALLAGQDELDILNLRFDWEKAASSFSVYLEQHGITHSRLSAWIMDKNE